MSATRIVVIRRKPVTAHEFCRDYWKYVRPHHRVLKARAERRKRVEAALRKTQAQAYDMPKPRSSVRKQSDYHHNVVASQRLGADNGKKKKKQRGR